MRYPKLSARHRATPLQIACFWPCLDTFGIARLSHLTAAAAAGIVRVTSGSETREKREMAVSRWTREAVARDIESGRLSLRILAETIDRMDRITHRLLMPTLGTLDAEFRAREDAEIAGAEA